MKKANKKAMAKPVKKMMTGGVPNPNTGTDGKSFSAKDVKTRKPSMPGVKPKMNPAATSTAPSQRMYGGATKKSGKKMR